MIASTDRPTAIPTVGPSFATPTIASTDHPTAIPTETPSESPSMAISSSPTMVPSTLPTEVPTGTPTIPVTFPSTISPSSMSSELPTTAVTAAPSVATTSEPTYQPSFNPPNPVQAPPVPDPVAQPSSSPSLRPTRSVPFSHSAVKSSSQGLSQNMKIATAVGAIFGSFLLIAAVIFFCLGGTSIFGYHWNALKVEKKVAEIKKEKPFERIYLEMAEEKEEFVL
jgi:hypothetical protein